MRKLSLLFALLSAASVELRAGRYVLILSDPPLARQVVSRKDLHNAAVSDRRRSMQDKQSAIADSLEGMGVHTLGSIQTLANAVFVEAPEDRLASLRALPGVVGVYPDIPLKPTMNAAAQLMNAPAAWTALGGADRAGLGTRIAVLDSGIDLNHPMFKDTSLSAPSPAIDCTKGTASSGACSKPNNKVIVTRNYMKQVNYYWQWDATTSKPKLDTDPADTRPDDFTERDHTGHGTAVAAIAAGARVSTPAGVTISGIAPKARIGVYKIFGSPGLNEITYLSALQSALEDALLDNMDVAVVGVAELPIWLPGDKPTICAASKSFNGYCDWTVGAIRNAITNGLVVVTSAGNNGDLGTTSPLGSITTPGTIPEVITVGATTNSHIAWQTVKISGGSVPAELQSINAYFGNGPKPVQPLTAPVIDVTTLGNDGYACTALPAGSLLGKIALIQRGNCVRDTKVNNANAAGAVGVILYEDSSHRDFVFYMSALQGTGIPAVLIGNTAGTSLKTYLSSTSNVTATLDPAIRLVDTNEVDVVPYFSSQGPSIDGIIKPELVATGTDLYTATQSLDASGALYSSSGYTAAEGTSFSAAIVAGAAALVLQQHPNYTPAQVKSALVNTANTRVFELDQNQNAIPASVNAVGAGKLDAAAALQTNVTVEPATASLGFTGSFVTSIPFRITNTGNSPVTLSLAIDAIHSDTATQVVLSAQTLTLGAGQSSSNLSVVLRGTPSIAGIYSGDITIHGGAVDLHVPYEYSVGDNAAANILQTQGINWVRPVDDQTLYISARVLDQYGVPVANVPSQFTPRGQVLKASGAATDEIGWIGANVQVGSTVGEQQFTLTAGPLTTSFPGRARQRPVIDKVFDAANYKTSAFAPGSYISIQNLGNPMLAESTQVLRTPNLPVSMSGVAVSFDVPDAQISVPGHVSYVSPSQINVQVPYELAGQSKANLKVMLWDNNWNDTTSVVSTSGTRQTFQVNLTDYQPGFFPFDPSFAGCQCPAALDKNYGYVTTNNPVKRGDFVQLFMNGLGPVTNQPASGDPAPSDPAGLAQTKTLPTVTIGGVSQQVLFSGLAPGFVGLYQVNVLIANNTPTGVQPVNFSINGASITTNLPIQ